MTDISDLRSTIVPRSDQTNADDLIAGPRTITIERVTGGSTPEQPINLHYIGGEGRPYRPCKTCRRILVLAWGVDGRAWVGRSMTIYHDPSVRFGGEEVGGIRISHLSHIERGINVSLTSTRGKKTTHTVKPLAMKERQPLSEKHAAMVAEFEQIAREFGFEAFKSAWEKTEKPDRAAIGTAERDRIGEIGRQRDSNPESTQA